LDAVGSPYPATDVYFSDVNVVEPDVVFVRAENMARIEKQVHSLCSRHQGRYEAPIMLGRGDLLTSPEAPGFSLPVEEILGPREDDAASDPR
jgi:hypothetical protein